MNTDRYEIKEKIGQGGIGAVYRAFDRRLSRDIAIKRVLPDGGFENQEEAIEHLLKEAKSLSSVQHPHIVTVYDAGVDEEGPYVVMELLEGRTLDEMVERGSLTFEDFKEVAIQTQEALIAAQDLNLVHRDLKPTNVMVTWLPSGKFQMKLVDFGLAKFSPKPSLQTIDHGDAVFGSIHFMAPEQFERTPLDQRTDMYSMGCMYYFALTGLQPFGGETAPEVMGSHLKHRVTPLAELRPDLPRWVCDWVMWHIEREMDKRPSNARESFQKFLMSDQPNPETPDETTPEQSKRPKLVFPGAETPATPAVPATPAAPPAALPPAAVSPPAEIPTGTAPQPIEPPAGQQPSMHTTSQVTASQPLTPPAAPVSPTPPAAPVEAAPPPQASPAPAQPIAPAPAAPPATGVQHPPQAAPAQPVAPVPSAQPVAPAAPLQPAAPATPVTPAAPGQIRLAGAAAPPPAAAPATAPGGLPPGVRAAGPIAQGPSTFISGSTDTAGQKGISNAVKITIAAVLVVAIIFSGIFVLGKTGQNRETERANQLLAQVEDLEARDLPTTGDDVGTLLRLAISLEQNTKRKAIYRRLHYAKSSDGTNIDAMIAEFAANEENKMIADTRNQLFQVVEWRKSPDSLKFLISHAQSAQTFSTAAAALRAAEQIATDKDLGELLTIIDFTKDEQVRQSAKRVISSLASRSGSRDALIVPLKNSYTTATTPESKRTFLELLGVAGGEEAATLVKEALKDKDTKIRLAAVAALGNWADDTEFETLRDFISEQESGTLRGKAFDTAYHFLQIPDRERDEFDLEDMWKSLAREAQTTIEKMKILTGLASIQGPVEDWAFAVVEFFLEDEEDRVSALAEKALERMEERRKVKTGGTDKDDGDEPTEEEEAPDDPEDPENEEEDPAPEEEEPAEE